MGIQVEELTRNLMPWGKEYIDFSFAGRHISEFGLVAVTSGDRYQFAGSPEFEDETSNVNGVWGQYYWGTNFKTKTYSYSLATDGMTERQFEDFKYHFRPGHYGQFYEDAWFDRYCYVRIKAVVDFSFIPFQEEVEVAGVKFPSRIYKGECKISFIQDRPFMYSFYQVLDSKISELGRGGDNAEAALRMMYHSNIPARDSWTKNIKCATGSWFSLPVIEKTTIIEKDENGKVIKRTVEEVEQADNSIIYPLASQIPYYNPSTTRTETKIDFTLDRTITTVNPNVWEPVYFNEIYDEFTNTNIPYNTISTTDKILSSRGGIEETQRYTHHYKYGLPEVSSDINKAINVAWTFYQENIRGALVELQNRLQEELINGRVLMWAVKVLQKIQTNQTLYRATEQEASESNRGWGILIDAQDDGTGKTKMDAIQKDAEEIVGEIIFHSGDYKYELYDNETDIEGCFRPNKITVYAKPIYNQSFQVDWFGYFNVMMLLMFGDFEGRSIDDITTENTFSGFYPCSFKFDGEKGMAHIDYQVNYLYDDKILKENVLDENCSNIIASNYLEVEGGDTIDVSTGKIASYHILGFNHGEDETIKVKNLKLQYKYTYA